MSKTKRVTISILVTIFSITMCGVAVEAYWLWFISPIGFPLITTTQGIGIYILFQLLSGDTLMSFIKEEKEWEDVVWKGATYPVLILFTGYLVDKYL